MSQPSSSPTRLHRSDAAGQASSHASQFPILPSTKPEKLRYVSPWKSFAIVAAAFLLFNYLAFRAEGREDYWNVKPEYLGKLETVSLRASRSGEWYATPLAYLCLVLSKFEEHVVGVVGPFGQKLFFSSSLLHQACSLAWIIHFFEVGVCVNACRRCNASGWTTFRYVVPTLLGGLCQLNPLKEEVKAYEKREMRRHEKLMALKENK